MQLGGGGGKCTTTFIVCRLGAHRDPAVQVFLDQLKMWFFLLEQEHDGVALAKAWSLARFQFAKSGWASVKGPIGAMVGM